MVIEAARNQRFSVDDEAGDSEWFDAIHAVHQRMLMEMDLSSIEKMDAGRAREAVTVAARQLVTVRIPAGWTLADRDPHPESQLGLRLTDI